MDKGKRRGVNPNLIEDGTPRLLKKSIKKGAEESLYVEYQLGYDLEKGTSIRRKEYLSLYLITTPKTPVEREQNRETLLLAKKIRRAKEERFIEEREGFMFQRDTKVNFFFLFEEYISTYQKKDIRVIEMALRRFREFLEDNEEYKKFTEYLKPAYINKDMMAKFTDYLKKTCSGSTGAWSVYQRFKKVINYMVEKGFLRTSPCKGVTIKADTDAVTKEILTQEEITTLIKTPVVPDAPEVRKAFIFSCYTGLRWADIINLRYGNIDRTNRLLRFEQTKTKGHSSSSVVTIPLRLDLIDFLGKGEKSTLLFHLPTHNGALYFLRRWCKAAGIDKHITWHCARHSYAVALLSNGADIKTVSSLMGHSSIAMTEKYLHVVDQLREKAINSLPRITL